MTGASWHPVETALDHAAACGHIVDLWLRDDDAVAATPALERLAAFAERHGMPVLLAVIPAHADESLRRFVEGHPILTPTQHGFAHVNHAAPGERARELGARTLADSLDDLAQGADRLCRMFGTRMTNILVPPWNRIDRALLPHLPGLGFRALSTFGASLDMVPDLLELNSTIDIIDWRGGRACHPEEKLIGKLAREIEQAITHPRSIGLLTHHLVHDDACWAFLDHCLSRIGSHPAIRIAAADTLLSRAAAALI